MRRHPTTAFLLALILLILAAAAGLASAQPATRPSTQPAARPVNGHHVLIVSIDGLRPDIALRAEMPNLRSLMRRGAYTFWAYTTPAAVTLPSHTSMLTGVTIERHTITWNDERAVGKPVYPAVPTIFEVAHAHGLTTGFAAGKTKFHVFDKPGALDWKWIADQKVVTDPKVADHVAEIIRDHRPDLIFVHFPGVDTAGHAKGWGSPEQVAAAESADRSLGRVLKAIDEAGLTADTDIIVSSDHGGSGLAHGPNDDRSAHIPWVVAGPGVRQNYDLTLDRGLKVYTYDTFATALALAGIKPPDGIDGKVVVEIRPLPENGSELMGETNAAIPAAVTAAPATQPVSSAAPTNAQLNAPLPLPGEAVPFDFSKLPLGHVPDDCPLCRALRGGTMPAVQQ